MTIREIIETYYRPGTPLYDIFMDHAEKVTRKSLATAERVSHLKPDMAFIEVAAMLHDIGIFMTHSPAIHCIGEHPYICHGVLGRELLESIDVDRFTRHALVCERHTGAGITVENIRKNRLPLPERDLMPVTLEEEIICFADKFYSKKPSERGEEKDLNQVTAEMFKLDRSHGERFLGWIEKFVEPIPASFERDCSEFGVTRGGGKRLFKNQLAPRGYVHFINRA